MTTNLFTTNLFEEHDMKQREEQDKVSAVRLLRQQWFFADTDLSFGDYVESIVTPEDLLAEQIISEATKQEQARNELVSVVEETARRFGISNKEALNLLQVLASEEEKEETVATSSPVAAGAMALIHLQMIQGNIPTYMLI